MNHGSNIIAIIIITALVIGVDLYVFQGVKTLTLGWQDVKIRSYILWGYWILSGLVLFNMFTAFWQLTVHQNFTSFSRFAFNTFIIFFLSKFVFIIILFGEDMYRGVAGFIKLISNSGHVEEMIPGRRKFISQAGIILAGINFSSLVYGTIKGKYQYKLHKQTIYFPDLPDKFDGFKIIQLSDIHSGSFDNPDAVQKGIDIVKAQKADMFVFTGDIVNNKAEELIPWINHFNQIKAPYGQYSILGNHDYGDYVPWESKIAMENNLDHLKELHKELGYRLLLNENVDIEKDGQKISLIGVENWGEGFVKKGDLNKAVENIDTDRFKILLSHDPSHWDEEVKDHPSNIHLTLSGHTHGMQMGIETPKFKFSPVQFRYKNWAGLAEEKGKYLYVNRGFGFIGYSGRIGIWPEITVLELRKG